MPECDIKSNEISADKITSRELLFLYKSSDKIIAGEESYDSDRFDRLFTQYQHNGVERFGYIKKSLNFISDIWWMPVYSNGWKDKSIIVYGTGKYAVLFPPIFIVLSSIILLVKIFSTGIAFLITYSISIELQVVNVIVGVFCIIKCRNYYMDHYGS